jgi:uncharacterized NAD(P)/FAD-binding protein YdhS
MVSRDSPAVAVIGGGLSGALVADRLLRASPRPLRITLIEVGESVGAGVAYSAPLPEHLLNVPTKSMSAVAGEPDHFMNWLLADGLRDSTRWGATADPNGFVPRALYGLYVAWLLADAEHRARADVAIERVRGEAVAVVVEGGRARVTLRDGRSVEADRVVLALGNALPAHPTRVELPFYASPRYVRDPWSPDVERDLPVAAPVLVLGTNLTMMDVVFSLEKGGHRGTIIALSTHGLTPPTHHLPLEPCPPFLDGAAADGGIRGLMHAVRERARSAAAQAHDWREVMDSIRPLGQQVWLSLSEGERRRFVRHVRAHWEVHRHRAAPAAAESIDRMRGTGRLVIRAGRIEAFAERGRRVDVTFRPRNGRARLEMVQVERVINATGPDADLRRVRSPLIRQLLHDGWCRPGPLGLGFDATPQGEIIGANGKPSPVLATLGPPLRGVLWETTAVPEIRAQAAALAARFVGELLRD